MKAVTGTQGACAAKREARSRACLVPGLAGRVLSPQVQHNFSSLSPSLPNLQCDFSYTVSAASPSSGTQCQQDVTAAT